MGQGADNFSRPMVYLKILCTTGKVSTVVLMSVKSSA